MVSPTLKNRIYALDVLRGFAVLGILLANIESFAGPAMSEGFSSGEAKGGIDALIDALLMVFVNGKFRSTLAILFGVGLYLQYRKRSSLEGNWPGGYLKRSALLAVIGIAHGVLIWYGDILFLYSIVSFAACWFAGLDSKIIKTIILVISIGLVLCCSGMTALLLSFGGDPSGNGGFSFGPFQEGAELRIFQHGTYLEQLGARSIFFAFMTIGVVVFGPVLFALFLLGILVARSGVLANPSSAPQTRNAALLAGFGLGLPLNLVSLVFMGSEDAGMFQMLFIESIGGPLLALGYLMGVAVLVEKGLLPGLTGVLEKVGRVALSVYLLQSLICTAIFYSWGGGLFGKLDSAEQLILVLVVWAVVIVFAHIWLRRFMMGPIEWVWRSATENRVLPFRRETTTDSEELGVVGSSVSEIQGRWDLQVGNEPDKFPSWVEIREGAGEFVGRVGSARPLREVIVEGNRVRFALPPQYEQRNDELVFEGELLDGVLRGTTLSDKGEVVPWEGRPAPALGHGEPTWGAEIDLIGSDLTGWRLRSPDWENNWTVQNGELINSKVGSDLITEKTFTDFVLETEYSYPGKSNSGIYLRGRYEFQIVDDYGREPHVGGSGAIYGFLAPKVNAIRAAGERNQATIKLVGRHVTITLNGAEVVDGDIPGITGGALDSDEGTPGPLFVQGDHGPVTFHRLRLRIPTE